MIGITNFLYHNRETQQIFGYRFGSLCLAGIFVLYNLAPSVVFAWLFGHIVDILYPPIPFTQFLLGSVCDLPVFRYSLHRVSHVP